MRRGDRIACSLLSVAFWLAAAVPATHGEKQIDVKQELELLKQGRLTRHIPGAKQRIAVFTFEDPDRTGLGDALAALTGRSILIESSFTSLGVLRYQGDLAPAAPGAPSYFDKVDQIVEAQNVSLAVWGRVRRSKESILIDAYLQLPSDVVETYFAWSLQLPQEMGGHELAVRLRPSRIVVQRLELSEASIPALLRVAAGMDALRAQPAIEATVSARLPQGRTYSLQERRGDWVLLRVDEHLQGWAQRPSCPGECGAALSTGVFAGAMLRFIAEGIEPPTPDSLTVEARAALDQMRAFKAMSRPSDGRALARDLGSVDIRVAAGRERDRAGARGRSHLRQPTGARSALATAGRGVRLRDGSRVRRAERARRCGVEPPRARSGSRPGHHRPAHRGGTALSGRSGCAAQPGGVVRLRRRRDEGAEGKGAGRDAPAVT